MDELIIRSFDFFGTRGARGGVGVNMFYKRVHRHENMTSAYSKPAMFLDSIFKPIELKAFERQFKTFASPPLIFLSSSELLQLFDESSF